MRRRKFVAKAAVAGAAALAAACTRDASRPTETGERQRARLDWRLVLTIPKTLPIWGPGVERFAARVRAMSQGELSIRVYGAGELVPALGTFDAVKAGQVEMGHSAAYYWQGKVPAAAFFTAVPFGLNANGMNAWLAHGGGQALWDELYAQHGLVAFPAGNTGMQMGGWFNREIRAIADFKGLKMRIPGLGGKVVAKAGGEPILVAGGEIYTNLSTGVIDATEWVGPYHDYVLGLHKAARYYYYPRWHEPGPVLELMINKAAWDKLPEHLQQIVKSCAAELDREMYAEWLAQDAVHLAKIRSEGKVDVRPFPDEVLDHLERLAREVNEEVAQESPLARRIHDSFMTFKASFDAQQVVTEHAYVRKGART